MRSAWQEHVAKTRRKGNRGKNEMSHREAMKAASVSWPKEKAKLLRKQKRECKARVAKKPPSKKHSGLETENEKSSAE